MTISAALLLTLICACVGPVCEGVVEIVRQREADHDDVVERSQTAPGARTGLFVPRLSTLFVALPARGGAAAEIRVYRII